MAARVCLWRRSVWTELYHKQPKSAADVEFFGCLFTSPNHPCLRLLSGGNELLTLPPD